MAEEVLLMPSGLKGWLGALLVAILGWLVQAGGEWLLRRSSQPMITEHGPIQPGIKPGPPADPAPSPEPPPKVPEEWVSIEGDKFDIFVMSQEYRWELGTTNVKTPGGAIVAMDQKLDALLEQVGRRYHDLIAVGNASCEGDDEEERVRAGERAHQLVLWLREALTRIGDVSDRRLHRLRLGRFSSCSGAVPGKTDDQRRVILVAVKQRLANMDLASLAEALRVELDDAGRLPLGFPLSSYPEFVLEEAR